MKNDFEQMCDRIDNCRCGCKNNVYKCAEKAVRDYVKNDREKMLQLKAQAEGGNFYDYSAMILAMSALVLTAIDNMMSYPGDGSGVIGLLYCTFKIVIVVGWALFSLHKIIKYKNVLKWRKYILIAIDETEKECV